MEAMARLRHPNVVQVYDVGDTDGWPYFTMEFLEGGSLAQKLTGTPQPARQAAQLLATLAEAVQAAHRSGIVHRDLKPGNVLLTADGTPKISDFGLVRRLDTEGGLTRTGAPLGTPSYMAPEQAQGKGHAIGSATDVYALVQRRFEKVAKSCGLCPFCRASWLVGHLRLTLGHDLRHRLRRPIKRMSHFIPLANERLQTLRQLSFAGEVGDA
jgi:serine/threonine protein kinase